MLKRFFTVTALCFLLAAAAHAASNQPTKAGAKNADPPARASEPFIVRAMQPYFAIRKSLGVNSVKGVPDNAAAFAKTVQAEIARLEKQKKQSEELGPLNNILKAAQPLASKQGNFKSTRAAFGKLCDVLVDYMNKYVGLYYTKDYKIYYCNISKHYWVQKTGEKMVNPYYGREVNVNDPENCGDGTQAAQPSDAVPGRDSVLKCEPRSR